MDKTSSGFDADSAQVSRWLWAVRIATILSLLSFWSFLYLRSAHDSASDHLAVALSFVIVIIFALPFVGILFALNSARWRLAALGMAVGTAAVGIAAVRKMALQGSNRTGDNPPIGPLLVFLAPWVVLISTAVISWGRLWRDPRTESSVLIRWLFFLCFWRREPGQSARSATGELIALFAYIGIGVAVGAVCLLIIIITVLITAFSSGRGGI